VGYDAPGYVINFATVLLILVLHVVWFAQVKRRARAEVEILIVLGNLLEHAKYVIYIYKKCICNMKYEYDMQYAIWSSLHVAILH
jgi:hypothetical protein